MILLLGPNTPGESASADGGSAPNRVIRKDHARIDAEGGETPIVTGEHP
ncbi:hypothetical protein [Nioella aestuarii]